MLILQRLWIWFESPPLGQGISKTAELGANGFVCARQGEPYSFGKPYWADFWQCSCFGVILRDLGQLFAESWGNGDRQLMW